MIMDRSFRAFILETSAAASVAVGTSFNLASAAAKTNHQHHPFYDISLPLCDARQKPLASAPRGVKME
jgi:hypothetical protein